MLPKSTISLIEKSLLIYLANFQEEQFNLDMTSNIYSKNIHLGVIYLRVLSRVINFLHLAIPLVGHLKEDLCRRDMSTSKFDDVLIRPQLRKRN